MIHGTKTEYNCKNDEFYTYTNKRTGRQTDRQTGRQTDRQTDRQTNEIMAPCTHSGTSREVNEARWPHACSRPCAFEEKNESKKNTRGHARKHVPRVSPCSPASIDPEFVEVGLVQLSQSVKTTNVTHCQTHRQTDRHTN